MADEVGYHLGCQAQGRCRCHRQADMTPGTLDLDPLIAREAQKIISGERTPVDRFLVRSTDPRQTHVEWTGVGGTTQYRPLPEDRTWDYTTQVQDYAKILARTG